MDNELTYDTMISDRVVMSVIKKLNENEIKVEIKEILLFNDSTFDYVKIEPTLEQLKWYEAKVALKYFNGVPC